MTSASYKFDVILNTDLEHCDLFLLCLLCLNLLTDLNIKNSPRPLLIDLELADS